MKFLFSVTLSVTALIPLFSTASLSRFGTQLQCTDSVSNVWMLSYDLNKKIGTIERLNVNNKTWIPEYSDAEVLQDTKSGSLTVLGYDSSTPDWKSEKNCFSQMRPTLRFVIRQKSKTVQVSSNFQFNPEKISSCAAPKSKLPPLREMNCAPYRAAAPKVATKN